ncbi:MAG: DUF899 family protein [Deltaproteobacteria bacterium]|nr:DUF899 family protein [Deltaproteobacteria bacterium]
MSNVENPRNIEYPKIASRADWLNARKELLAKEQELTRHPDARDLNEAIQMGSKIPPTRVGSIEVRPIRQLNRG